MHPSNTILMPATPPSGHRLRLAAQWALLLLPLVAFAAGIVIAVALLV